MNQAQKHKVFISYHVEDQAYKDRFVSIMADYMVDKSVNTGDIVDSNLHLDEIRRRIRDNFIADATVTVVLISACTWRRKHVDWEIGSSLRGTNKNRRCGLLGIVLPNHPDYGTGKYNLRLLPPRLADNCEGGDPYALVRKWPRGNLRERTRRTYQWIHEAFERRNGTPPKNGRRQFAKNRSGECSAGWKS